MLTPELADERVALGVAWLNEHYPSWRKFVTYPEMRIEHCYSCVMGILCGSWQLFMTYNRHSHGPEKIHDIKKTGFTLEKKTGEDWDAIQWDEDWASLQEAWDRELRRKT